MTYDEWKTAIPATKAIVCQECGCFEAIDEICIDDEEPGMVRRVWVCHLCIKDLLPAKAG
jgi:hypothetical protein